MICSDSQKDQLKALLAPLSASDFSQQAMLGQFAIAKSFVQQSVFQKNNLSNLINIHAYKQCLYILDYKVQ